MGTDKSKDTRAISEFLRQLAVEIDERGVVYISAKNEIEQIEIRTLSATREYRLGPHMSFTLELDWKDIAPSGEDDRDIVRPM